MSHSTNSKRTWIKGFASFSCTICLLIAMASCLVLSACGASQEEKQQLAEVRALLSQKITVVVLAKDVEAGKSLTADDIKLEEIFNYMYPYGGFTEKYESKKEDSQVLGCVTTRYLGGGAVLMPGDIYPKKDDKAKETKSDSSTEKTEEKSDKKEDKED